MNTYNHSSNVNYRRERRSQTTKALCFLLVVGLVISVSVVAQLSQCVKEAHGSLSKEIQCAKDGDKVAAFDLTVAFLILGLLGFFTIIIVLAACDLLGIFCLPCYGCCVGFEYLKKRIQNRAWLNETGVTAARATRVAQHSENSKQPELWSRLKDWTKQWSLLNILRRLRRRSNGSKERRLEAGSDMTLPPYTPSTYSTPAPPYEVAVAQTWSSPLSQTVTTYEPPRMELPPTLRTPTLTVPSPTHPSPTRTSHRASSLYGSDIFSTSNSSLSVGRR